MNYSTFKNKLADDLIKFLEPLREKRMELEKKSKEVINILNHGTKKTLTRAEETINLVEGNEDRLLKYRVIKVLVKSDRI